MLKRFLFPAEPAGVQASVLLLLARVAFGLLFMSHGLSKWSGFQELSATFPDPLGVGSELSLCLAIFGEVACAAAFIVGLLHRLVLIPMMFTMCVAFFVVHGGSPSGGGELSLVYLLLFVLLYVAGPGKVSVDHWLGRQGRRRK